MRRFQFLPLVLASVLAGCGSGSTSWTPLPSGVEPPANCARAGADGVIEISAHDSRFNAPCMAALPGKALVVRFTNNDSDQHNVVIYSNRSKSKELMRGETTTGPQVTKDYAVKALPAGEYYFECLIHPGDMNGALYVR
jgi:plastocyanin